MSTATAIQHADLSATDLRPLQPTIGAEIHGVDISKPVTATQRDAIRAIVPKYKVEFFGDQQLDNESHAAFAREFGPLYTIPVPLMIRRSRRSTTSPRATMPTLKSAAPQHHSDDYARVVAKETGIPFDVAQFTVASYLGSAVPIDAQLVREQTKIFERYHLAGIIPAIPDADGGTTVPSTRTSYNM